MAQTPTLHPETALLYTYSEVALLLKISRSSVYLLVEAGTLKPVHIKRSARFTRAELDRFVATLESDAS